MSVLKWFSPLFLLLSSLPVSAGLITYSELDEFAANASTPLTLEGFNDNELSGVSVESGYIRYRDNDSLVSEGELALVLRERNAVTFLFDREVFDFGFYVNELNSTNLNYSDSAGNEIIDAFKITDIWYASTFFGVTSDVGITSFTLTGSGTSSAVYGIDALQFTAVAVSEPSTWMLLFLATLAVWFRRVNKGCKPQS